MPLNAGDPAEVGLRKRAALDDLDLPFLRGLVLSYIGDVHGLPFFPSVIVRRVFPNVCSWAILLKGRYECHEFAEFSLRKS